ncbi:MAG: hypothetical protein ACI4OH_05160 [Mitsuokella sp.]|uniref:hypothetical protein n=1 Tax=Mitsuokella sp. TaxID=2049034 RepID=UPI003EFDFB22
MKDVYIEEIHKIAKFLLDLPVRPDKRIPFIASHPFTNSVYIGSTDGKLLDLTKKEDAAIWREKMERALRKRGTKSLLFLINPPYRLFFLKFIEPYCDPKEFGELFREAWPTVECITKDPNVSREDIIEMIRPIPKSFLMTPELMKAYGRFPDTFTAYRGVTSYNEKSKDALSWTTDIVQAKWFATRFHEHGTVWKVTAKKEWILMLMSSDENEVLLDIPEGTEMDEIDPDSFD